MADLKTNKNGVEVIIKENKAKSELLTEFFSTVYVVGKK